MNKDDSSQQMDDAAEKAIADFEARVQDGKMTTAGDVTAWMKSNYMKAGYRRLCRYWLNESSLAQSTGK